MKKFFALIATASLMFSCSQEDITSNFEKLPINISVGQQTRANDSTFENEDEVGIYVVNYDGSTAGTLAASGNQVDNERFIYNNGTWTPDETIYWKDQSTAADFYAYYPYSESVDIAAHPFVVMADQSTEDNFWASDFLWGKATKVTPTSAAVPIVTNHSLSRIIVNVKPGNGFTEEAWAAAAKSVKVCDVVTSATIDLSTGTATATGDKGAITPLATDGVYKAMLVPQVVADNSKLVVVTVDGVDYVYRKGYTFKRNTQHTFTITVNKKGGNVDVTIGEWEMDENINEGNAEEEAIIPNNKIWYTTTDETIVEPYDTDAFSANIVSNTYENGRGIITFDGDVTSIGEKAFYNCSNLTSVTIPNRITEIGDDAFYGCSSITKVDVSDLSAWCKIDFDSDDANPLNKGAKLYLNNNEISELSIPSDITEIKDYAFYSCSSLTRITIPNNVTSIGDCAFEFCCSLTSITIPDSVTSIGTGAFSRCRNLTNITIPDNMTSIENSTFWLCSSLTSITIPNNVTKIGDYVFDGCSSLTSITIPDNVTSIGSCAFSHCSSLTNITIPDNVTSIGSSAFYECSSLTNITIPTSVTSIEGNTFAGCSCLTSIAIPDSVTSIGKYAFSECHSLTNFYGKFASKDNRCLIVDGVLHSFAPANLTTYTIPDCVTSIGGSAFKRCYNLTSIIIPDSVTSIEYGAFGDCSSLTNITIPTSVTSIGGDTFAGCSSLTSITIPDSVTSIEYGAFAGCSSLTSITIPDSVTSIGSFAFEGCISLESVSIPANVTTIGFSAFAGCTKLAKIFCHPISVPTIVYSPFYNTYSDLEIYVPTQSVEAYKTDKNWREYASYIVGYDFE